MFNSKRLDRMSTRISALENRLSHRDYISVQSNNYTYETIVKILEEAGILVEDNTKLATYINNNNKRYRIKKVK